MEAVTDSARFEKLIRDLVRDSPRLLREVVRDEAGLLARDIARMTPPRRIGQGKRAVARDINRVFKMASAVYRELRIKNPDLAKGFWKAIRANRHEEAERMIKGIVDANIIPTADSAIHRKARNKFGRVSPTTQPTIVADARSVRDYIRARQANVGYTKSPWAKAANALGRRQLATWMTAANGPGTFVDGTSSLLTPSVTIGSKVRHADSPQNTGIVKASLGRREKAVQTRIEKGYNRMTKRRR